MRILAAALAVTFLGVVPAAQAQYSPQELQYYCSMGSQTPNSVRPYCGGYHGPIYRDRDYGYYGHHRLSWEEIRYYCGMGSQTPVSLRPTCIRAGLAR